MSGPPRKPEAERKRSSRPAPIMLSGRVAKAPPPPADLLATTRSAWESFWRSPQAKYVDPSTDLMALVRLFRLYDEQERAYRQLTGKGAKRIVEGSKGQPRLSPLYSLIDRLDAKILAVEDRFGLSPRARQNLGVKRAGGSGGSLDDLNQGLAGDETPELEDDERDDDAGEAEDPRHLAAQARGRRAS